MKWLFIVFTLLLTGCAGAVLLEVDPQGVTQELAPGQNVDVPFVVTNSGTRVATYNIEILIKEEWASAQGVPQTITLNPQDSQELSFPLNVPQNVRAGDQISIIIVVSAKDGSAANQSQLVLTVHE